MDIVIQVQAEVLTTMMPLPRQVMAIHALDSVLSVQSSQ
jgi:hypothetical protein